jgi:hypothetical protein
MKLRAQECNKHCNKRVKWAATASYNRFLFYPYAIKQVSVAVTLQACIRKVPRSNSGRAIVVLLSFTRKMLGQCLNTDHNRPLPNPCRSWSSHFIRYCKIADTETAPLNNLMQSIRWCAEKCEATSMVEYRGMKLGRKVSFTAASDNGAPNRFQFTLPAPRRCQLPNTGLSQT